MAAQRSTRERLKRFPTHIVVFLAPAVIIYSVFMIFPLVNSLRFSLYAPGEEAGAAISSWLS